jgi:hypothetical protein
MQPAFQLPCRLGNQQQIWTLLCGTNDGGQEKYRPPKSVIGTGVSQVCQRSRRPEYGLSMRADVTREQMTMGAHFFVGGLQEDVLGGAGSCTKVRIFLVSLSLLFLWSLSFVSYHTSCLCMPVNVPSISPPPLLQEMSLRMAR